MLEYIKGQVSEITPAFVILENMNMGYFVNISLHTYSSISQKQECHLFIHEILREDAYMLYGFADKAEREIFRNLLSVSGVGANTACMMLSSLSPDELKRAIVQEQVKTLQSIKGIGAKSAQRIIVDLKDKLEKEGLEEQIVKRQDNTIREEALSALVTLGFQKRNVEKVIEKLIHEESNLTVEKLVKSALKKL